jgi:hypothetical protein
MAMRAPLLSLPPEGVTFDVRLPEDPPTANSRLCWQVRARKTKTIRNCVALVARSHRNRLGLPPADERRRLELVLLRGPRSRARDHDQTVAALKVVVDGIRDSGWLKDDKPRWLDYPMPTEGRDPRGGVSVRVTVKPAP